MRPSGQTKGRSQYHPTAKPVLSTLLFCLVTLETETMGGFEMLKFSESQYLFIIKSFVVGGCFSLFGRVVLAGSSFPTRDQTQVTTVKSLSPNHWTTGELPGVL